MVSEIASQRSLSVRRQERSPLQPTPETAFITPPVNPKVPVLKEVDDDEHAPFRRMHGGVVQHLQLLLMRGQARQNTLKEKKVKSPNVWQRLTDIVN